MAARRGDCLLLLCLALAALQADAGAASTRRAAAGRRRRRRRNEDVRPSLSFIGRIKAVNTVQLRARVEGFLEKRLFSEGQYVKAGDLLYQIEKTQYQATRRPGQGQCRRRQGARSSTRRSQYNRATELVKTQAGTQATVDPTRAALDSAKARVLQNQAALTIARRISATPTSARRSTAASASPPIPTAISSIPRAACWRRSSARIRSTPSSR